MSVEYLMCQEKMLVNKTQNKKKKLLKLSSAKSLRTLKYIGFKYVQKTLHSLNKYIKSDFCHP